MIKEVTVVNNHNESLTLPLTNPWGTGLAVMSITGLNPPKANISTTELSTMDGSVFVSSRVGPRNIVLTLKILPNKTIEEVRHTLYKYFPIKKDVTFFIKTDQREAYTNCYVESNEIEIFSNFETAQISLICPDSYLYSVDEKSEVLYSVESLFTFPFSNPVGEKDIIFGEVSQENYKSIDYKGEGDTGVVIRMLALGPVTNPSVRNVTLDQTMLINSEKLESIVELGFIEGDEIYISTYKGSKTVTHVRHGVATNILSCLGDYSDWISLENGENAIVYSAEEGRLNLQVTISYRELYSGI